MNFNPKILIVEDEVLIAEYIKELLQDYNFNEVEMTHTNEDAIDAMNQFNPDVILMDINLNGINSGIELSSQKNKNGSIIFLTGQYDAVLMSKAIETNPQSYLTKPIKQNDLFAAIQLAILKTQVKSITIQDGYESIKLMLDTILYIKSDSNYIDIYTTTKKYSIRMSLDTFLNESKDPNFIRVHKSYIINKSKITKINTTTAFIDLEEIPISRNLKFKI
ncbi:DNA-binding response regulator [Flavobacterium sp. SUN052]|uniref:LytR/AlgR family response regulator transcription factor n=1 Tax=Flavobacterium sp. SUN052 TaxID=3002441 RepID=UPI00237D4106|nr:DNA-binding response regulator [Flavobacterium sp. SUN052]MEC4005946.1 DNA-binding response regulator [Flavobacterium sp. SUN052]